MVQLRRVDLEKETGGVWAPHEDGYAVKVRAFDCPRVQERLAKDAAAALATAQIADPSRKSLTGEEFEAVVSRVMGEEVIADWRGIDDAEGKPIPYSAEVAVKFMRDPELRHFQNHALRASRAQDRFLREGVKALEGN